MDQAAVQHIRMAAHRRGNWMQTFTGRVYWPVDPRPSEVCVEDIAHHLSMLCRYTGACRVFYCIAEHAWHVSYLVEEAGGTRLECLAGLHHDDPEAYTNDINRPLKRSPGMEGYRAIEQLNHVAIFTRLGLPLELPHLVEQADAEILFHEQAALMPPSPAGLDWGMGLPKPAVLRPEMINGWSPKMAELRFLERHKELTEWA